MHIYPTLINFSGQQNRQFEALLRRHGAVYDGTEESSDRNERLLQVGWDRLRHMTPEQIASIAAGQAPIPRNHRRRPITNGDRRIP